MIGNIVESGTVAAASPQNPSPVTSDNFAANPNSSVSQQNYAIIKNDGLLLNIGT
jgi:hypothetical protein